MGAMLAPWLAVIDQHDVTVFDLELFGKGCLPEDNPHIRFVRGDVRDIRAVQDAMRGQDAVIWLASLSNNDMCVKYPQIHDRVNCDAVMIGLREASYAGVKRFIYASSVAAYGSTDHEAKEDEELQASTSYAEGKRFCEWWVKHYNRDDFTTVITRSASVCGRSVNMRFDLTANKMVHDAVRHKRIKVNGGNQKRCHIHIQDACQAYRLLLEAPAEKVSGQAFNLVAENQTVLETANIVAEEASKGNGIPPYAEDFVHIEMGPATDDRSYSVDGTKAREVLGFEPKRTVREAALEIATCLHAGMWPDSLTNQALWNMSDALV